MHKSEQIAQIKTMMARLDTGTTVDAGGVRYNPTASYVDPELAAQEWEAFFVGAPQMIGLSGDLPEPGSFLTVDDLDVPVLATRASDGKFRAFVNACRHRGVILETASRGTGRRLTCEFHSWSYDLDGTLVGLPKQDHFGDVDRDCLGLVELPAVERSGLLWISTDPNGAIDLDEVFGDALAAELDSWGFDQLHYLGADEYDVACNWKLAMDTFGETYHFTSLHRNTIANSFHGNVQCYDTFGRNHRMLLVRRQIESLRARPEEDWRITEASLPVYWLFPNVQLMPSEEGCYLVRAYPVPGEPGRHVSRISFYLWQDPATADVGHTEIQRQIAAGFAEIIRDEDYVMSASQQRTASSGGLEHVVFGRNEPALHHYHNTYRTRLGLDPLPLRAPSDAVGVAAGS
jgi:phenylpropionate dioxygenase-like ring-hydroxylating dioxygenase large terminal subunit